MEFNDLQHLWKVTEPNTEVFSVIQLRAIISQKQGVVDKMRRNTRWEIVMAIIVAVLMLVALWKTHETVYRLYECLSLGLIIVLLYYYYRVLIILRQMTEYDNNIRTRLAYLCIGLRQLLNFNYKLTIYTLPGMLATNFSFFTGRLLFGKATYSWQTLITAGSLVLLLGCVLQVGIVYIARFYTQQFYGQYLDRVESQLNSLDDSAE